MRHKTLGAALVLAAVVLACSTLKTTHDYDKSANFSIYKTWALREDGSIRNPLLAKRLESVLTAELARRGLTRVERDPDLWVVGHARMSKEIQVNSYNTGWGYGWRWGGAGVTTSTVSEIPVGTLIVDLVDAKQKELVWRGTASDTLDPGASPEEKEKKMHEAIAKMLESYPPR